MVDKAPFPFFPFFTNGRRLLTHLDGSYRSYRSSGYSGTNGASIEARRQHPWLLPKGLQSSTMWEALKMTSDIINGKNW